VRIKAVLDTNVFIPGVFWKGPPFEILKAWQQERFRLAISLPILQEYRRVLDELTKEQAVPVLTSVLKIIELHSEMVEPVSFAEPVCSDPDDDNSLRLRLLQVPVTS
jgi:putative PIN family toxin of toxin-antitoxin system